MSATNPKTTFLKSTGKLCIDMGLPIVPITEGTKAPLLKGWQHIESTQEELDKWLKNPKFTGVGILTKHFPAIDIDFKHYDASREIVIYCQKELGATLIRIGESPKALLPFRLVPGHEPMKKVKSPIYEDDQGGNHAVEVLGDGQQYVAYHIHPNTNEPYVWVKGIGLTDIDPEDLPTLNSEQVDRLMEKVAEVAAKYGLTEVVRGDSKESSTQSRTGSGDYDFIDAKPKVGLTVDEVHEKVMLLPDDHSDDYDSWIKIGMAIQHELGRTGEALAVWDEFSQQSGNYDPGVIEAKWASFDPYGHSNSVTMASVLHLVKDAEVDRKYANLKWLLLKIKQATNTQELTVDIPKQIGQTTLDALMYNELVLAMQRRYKTLTDGASLPIEDARKLCRPEVNTVKNALNGEGFPWCKDWTFLSRYNVFFNTETKETMSKDAFNHFYDHNLITAKMLAEETYRPLFRASDIATNIVQIPRCVDSMYAPDQDDIFTLDDNVPVKYANSYRSNNVSALKRDRWNKKQRDCIKRVEKILNAVSHNPRDRLIFRQWLNYIVQNIGSKTLTWSIVLQGAQGSGKTFWYSVMKAILGEHNTRPISATEMGRHFTGWAEGHSFGCVEEIKLHGHDRWDIINKLKPYISNSMVPIERKGRDSIGVLNTVTYLLLTNFKDALPLENSDRRFYPIFSALQTIENVTEYYCDGGERWWDKTFKMLPDCGDAVLGWLNETDMTGFNPGRAPESRAKDQMIALARSDEEVFITDLLDDPEHPHITRKLLMTHDITLEAMLSGEDLNLRTRSMQHILSALGFDKLPRTKIGDDNRSLWTRDPEVANYTKAQIRALYFEQKKALKNMPVIDDFKGSFKGTL